MFGNLFDEEEGDVRAVNGGEKPQQAGDKMLASPPAARPMTDMCGIENQGATCYLNSLLQTLLRTPEFRESLFQLTPKHLGHLEDKDIPEAKVRVIPIQLQRLFCRLLLVDLKAVSTVELTDSFGWSNNEEMEHHDVQELNRILFAAIENSLVGTPGKDLLTTLYRGSVINLITCGKCGRKSERVESFLDLNVAVKGYQSIEESLRGTYVEPELMNGNNQYRCEGCKQLVDAKKWVKFRSLPPILTISLMRFSYDVVRYERYKETCRFSFPHELDMTEYSDSENTAGKIYELFSVIIHQGNTHGGHYHAYIKDKDHFGNWMPPEDEPVIIPVDLDGKMDFVTCDTPLEVLGAILVQQPEHSLQLDQLSQQIVRWTGSPWNRRFKKHYGALPKFIQNHDEYFYYCNQTGIVSLEAGAVQEIIEHVRNVSSAEEQNNSANGYFGDDPCKTQTQKNVLKTNSEMKMNGQTNGVVNGCGSHDDHWFDFNDSTITCISADEISKQFSGKESAYMLFYRRKSQDTRVEVKSKDLGIPSHLIEIANKENAMLREKRTQYDLAVNSITVRLLNSCQYVIDQSALQMKDPEYTGLEISVDQRIPVRQFKEIVKEQFLEKCPDPLCIDICRETIPGLHLFQTLKVDDTSLKQAGVTSGSSLMCWNGTDVEGIPYKSGKQYEPILLHVSVISLFSQTNETNIYFPKCTKLKEVRKELVVYARIHEPLLSLSYVEKHDEESSTCVLLGHAKDKMTIEELGFRNGGKLFVEKKQQGINGMSEVVLMHANQITINVEIRAFPPDSEMDGSQTEKYQTVPVDIYREHTICRLKEQVMAMSDLPSGEYRLRVLTETGLKPPLHEDLKIEEAKLTGSTHVVLERGQSVEGDQIWLTYCTPDNAKKNEVVISKGELVLSCLDIVIKQMMAQGVNCYGWHLAKTNWNGETTRVLNEQAASTLEKEDVQHGDHLFLQEGGIAPKGFIRVTVWLFPSSDQGWSDNQALLEELNELWKNNVCQTTPAYDSSAMEVGAVDVYHDATLDTFRQAVMNHLNLRNIVSCNQLRLRLTETVSADNHTNGEAKANHSHPSSVSNSQQSMTNGSPIPTLHMGRVLRGHQQLLRSLKLTQNANVGVQVLPAEEDLSVHQLVLQVTECRPDTQQYSSPVELVWDASPANASSLYQAVSTMLQIPSEQLLLAKHFPQRYEWMVIRENDQKNKKSTSKTSLRNTPFHFKDADTIGVKNIQYSWPDLEEFGTPDDIEGRRKLKEFAEEKRKRRRDKTTDCPESEDQQECNGAARRQRTEEGIHIKVADFS